MTTTVSGLPHAEAFTAANPDIVQHRCDSKKCDGQERFTIWRNCDRNIRNWWRSNHHLVKSSHVVFLEWDVFCNVPLQSLLQPMDGVVCASIKRQGKGLRPWLWFSELKRLPAEMQAQAIGIVPLAVLQFTRAALDAICDPRHDFLYDEDIYAELRTASLLRHLGFPIHTTKSLKWVTWTALPFPWFHRGIFHPVKKSRADSWLGRRLKRIPHPSR